MVLVGLGIRSLIRKEGFSNILSNDNNEIVSYMLGGMGGLFLVMNMIPAILIAIHCNPDKKLMYSMIGLLFSDIYLLQWSIRKFIFKEKNYCKF